MLEKNVFQCYVHYLKQTIHSDRNIVEALSNLTPELIKRFFFLFDQKFNPQSTTPQNQEISDSFLPKVLLEAFECTMRTNAYVPQHQALVIKLVHKDGLIDIFMDHPLFQASFLKKQPIARGGIRLSDRSDFRNECLQLMQNQVLKNTLVVPSGAKGAFFLKDINQDPLMAHRIFVHGLLDISDNFKDQKVVQPAHVRCYDGNDFYNVIAADKGTAYFSDEANAISKARGYWLADAFASGGSTGYNHKALAITSRGVWICVRDHLGPWTAPLKVVGIGDMAGDIFGNGLLEETNIQLLGAFNHQSIFIDPTPDPLKSYAQRKVLFNTPGSRWEDYKDLSPGGMIISRGAKDVALTKEAQALLGFDHAVQQPNVIIQQLLKMPVDLLWLGGVGTFIKGEQEDHAMDPVNTDLRINGQDVGARVVGEGANLGCTFQGRLAYALKRGKINTDAIDNCAGVHCSDYEINLKILLDEVVRQGHLDLEERNRLLQEMAQEVCHKVLAHNHWQSLVLSLDQEDETLTPTVFAEFFSFVERESLNLLAEAQCLKIPLDRAPTRPELAFSLAYSKMLLRQKLEKSSLEKYGQADVAMYFPSAVRHQFGDWISSHLLYTPLKSTILTNKIIYLFGPFVLQKLHKICGQNFDKMIDVFLYFYTKYDGFEFFNKCQELFDNKNLMKKILNRYRHLFHQWLHKIVQKDPSLEEEKVWFSPLIQDEISRLF